MDNHSGFGNEFQKMAVLCIQVIEAPPPLTTHHSAQRNIHDVVKDFNKE